MTYILNEDPLSILKARVKSLERLDGRADKQIKFLIKSIIQGVRTMSSSECAEAVVFLREKGIFNSIKEEALQEIAEVQQAIENEAKNVSCFLEAVISNDDQGELALSDTDERPTLLNGA